MQLSTSQQQRLTALQSYAVMNTDRQMSGISMGDLQFLLEIIKFQTDEIEYFQQQEIDSISSFDYEFVR